MALYALFFRSVLSIFIFKFYYEELIYHFVKRKKLFTSRSIIFFFVPPSTSTSYIYKQLFKMKSSAFLHDKIPVKWVQAKRQIFLNRLLRCDYWGVKHAISGRIWGVSWSFPWHQSSQFWHFIFNVSFGFQIKDFFFRVLKSVVIGATKHVITIKWNQINAHGIIYEIYLFGDEIVMHVHIFLCM